MQIITYTHRSLDLLLVSQGKQQVDLLDILVPLKRIVRYNGHTCRPYTVAEHSVWMARAAGVILRDHPQQTYLQRLCLLHDAQEALIGDLIQPLKDRLPSLWHQLEDGLMRAIMMQFLGEPPQEQWLRRMRDLDLRIRVNEWDSLRCPLDQPTPCPYSLGQPLPIDIDRLLPLSEEEIDAAYQLLF